MDTEKPTTQTEGETPPNCAPVTGSDSGENIVSFRTGDPIGDESLPFTMAERPGYCERWCRNVFVCEKRRMLQCQDCGKMIDPFDYMAQWARKGDGRLGALKELDATLRKKGAELLALKAEVANAKAQLRRAAAPLFHQNK